MGIKNLLKLINMYPDLVEEKEIIEYKNKKIAIDISILLYQVVISVRNTGSDLTNNKGEVTSHILGLFNKTIKLLENKIIPVYVFDGKPPDLKRKVLDIRRSIRKKAEEKMSLAETEEEKIKYFKRSVTISKKQLDECRELLDLMGIPYVNAPEEADSQCAWLAEQNLVDAVLTEDMDILTFGSPKIVRNLTSQKKKPLEINLNKIKDKFGWTQNNFIEICVLFGCDYSDHITDISFLKLFHEYQKNKNIHKVLNKLNRKIDVNNTIMYFKNPMIDRDITNLTICNSNLEKLENLLVSKYGLIKYKIKKKLNVLKVFIK
jgi:flap endonuclease-1